MKGFTSILLLFIFMNCSGQDKICFDCYSQEYVDSLSAYKDSQLNTANAQLQKSAITIDSLVLRVKSLEERASSKIGRAHV